MLRKRAGGRSGNSNCTEILQFMVKRASFRWFETDNFVLGCLMGWCGHPCPYDALSCFSKAITETMVAAVSMLGYRETLRELTQAKSKFLFKATPLFKTLLKTLTKHLMQHKWHVKELQKHATECDIIIIRKWFDEKRLSSVVDYCLGTSFLVCFPSPCQLFTIPLHCSSK